MDFDSKKAYDQVVGSGKHLFIATDLLRAQGVKNANSKSKHYPRAKRVLQKLERDGFLNSRYFPEVGITVYWKIP